jgi:hypothetical protein
MLGAGTAGRTIAPRLIAVERSTRGLGVKESMRSWARSLRVWTSSGNIAVRLLSFDLESFDIERLAAISLDVKTFDLEE